MHRGSYQADADSLLVGHSLHGAFSLAALLHTNMDSRRLRRAQSQDGCPVRGRGLAASLALHLSSTTSLNDCYCVDVCSLAMVFWLFHQRILVRRGAYQAGADTVLVGYSLLGVSRWQRCCTLTCTATPSSIHSGWLTYSRALPRWRCTRRRLRRSTTASSWTPLGRSLAVRGRVLPSDVAVARAVAIHRGSCQADADSSPVGRKLLVALAPAVLLRAGMNGRPDLDVHWTTDLFVALASLAPRLFASMWLTGCPSVGAPRNVVYQPGCVCSSAMVRRFLHQVVVAHRGSYQPDANSLLLTQLLRGEFALAPLLRARLNSRPVLDTLRLAGLFAGVTSWTLCLSSTAQLEGWFLGTPPGSWPTSLPTCAVLRWYWGPSAWGSRASRSVPRGRGLATGQALVAQCSRAGVPLHADMISRPPPPRLVLEGWPVSTATPLGMPLVPPGGSLAPRLVPGARGLAADGAHAAWRLCASGAAACRQAQPLRLRQVFRMARLFVGPVLLALCLSSITRLDGHFPGDAPRDASYQILDVCSGAAPPPRRGSIRWARSRASSGTRAHAARRLRRGDAAARCQEQPPRHRCGLVGWPNRGLGLARIVAVVDYVAQQLPPRGRLGQHWLPVHGRVVPGDGARCAYPRAGLLRAQQPIARRADYENAGWARQGSALRLRAKADTKGLLAFCAHRGPIAARIIPESLVHMAAAGGLLACCAQGGSELVAEFAGARRCSSARQRAELCRPATRWVPGASGLSRDGCTGLVAQAFELVAELAKDSEAFLIRPLGSVRGSAGLLHHGRHRARRAGLRAKAAWGSPRGPSN